MYSVEWNTFSPSIFMTCAAEWVIKIWDVGSVTNTENPRPLFTFDLGGPVSRMTLFTQIQDRNRSGIKRP